MNFTISEWLALVDQQQLQVAGHVVLAMVLGALLGVERERANKPAGLRTHMFVAGASALLVALATAVVAELQSEVEKGLIRTDPIRIIEAVITGVSFLGAGTIIRGKSDDVEGLTTAASVLMACSVGICVAVHRIQLAVAITVLSFVVLRILGALRFVLQRHS